MLVQKITSDDKLVYITLILATIALVGIIIAIPVQEADAAYCAATCQKRLAEQKGSTNSETKTTTKTTTKSTEKQCYGIYCNKDNKEDDSITRYNNAIQNKNFIAIKISEACQLSGTCPTYKELADTYDNSDRYLSGDFYFDESQQLWKRTNPPIRNVFEIYKFMNMPWVVFVAADDYTWDRSKKILIESQLHYTDNRDIIENQVRIEYKGLNIDGCKSATIGWMNNGSEILLDVLNHFYSNCKDPIKYDPRIEIFMNSTIFPDCDKNCFYLKDQFKHELKAEHLTTVEEWERKNCKDDDENKYSKLTSYDRNKGECDRIRATLDIDSDDDKPCYGIYCDKKEKTTTEKSTYELRLERIKELEDIEKCKKEQIWDESKIDGRYRNTLYECDDKEDRNEYLDILTCEEVYDSNVDCNDEDQRKEHLNKIRAEPRSEEES